MIQLGTIADGRPLAYDASLFEFRLDRAVVLYEEVAQLDRAGHVNWLAAEQRDWFWRINPVDLDRCNRDALGRHGNGFEGLTPEEQVQADAKRDDSVLAGKIVEADPSLVQAVVSALEDQGLLAGGLADGAQPIIGMPAGMEALAQIQRHEGRKMTVMEHYLMRKILKNDDKAKKKREKEEEAIIAKALKEEAKERRELESHKDISAAQKHVNKRELEKARYFDSNGNPIRPEADAIRPSATQQVHHLTPEEQALVEMRERNLAAQAHLGSTPDYDSGPIGGGRRRRGINEGASINGRAVNADGSPKETKFTKFLGGASAVVKTVGPLAGGRGGGMGGGMGGGSGMGGGMR